MNDHAPAPTDSGKGTSYLARRDPVLAQILGTKHTPEAITNALQIAHEHWNLISPATVCGAVPVGCGVSLSLVQVDKRDCYPTDGGKFGLGKDAMKAIETALGVTWDPERSHRTDDGSHGHVFGWKAVGYYKAFDGTLQTLIGIRTLDVREGSAQVEAIRDRCRINALRKAEKVAQKAGRQELTEEEYEEALERAAEGARRQIRDLRLFIDAHAQTKAELRALGGRLKRGGYTDDDLAKPFVVAHLQWTGHTDDPDLKRELARMQFESMHPAANLAFSKPAPAAPAPTSHRLPPDTRPAEVLDTRPVEEPRRPRRPQRPPEPAVDAPPPPPKKTRPAPRQAAPAAAPEAECLWKGDFDMLGPDGTCRQGLQTADEFCDVCKAQAAAPKRAPAPAAAAPPDDDAEIPGDFQLPFGRSKGLWASAAPHDDLKWMRKCFAEGLDDPAKARFRAANQKRIAVIDTILGRPPQAAQPVDVSLDGLEL